MFQKGLMTLPALSFLGQQRIGFSQRPAQASSVDSVRRQYGCVLVFGKVEEIRVDDDLKKKRNMSKNFLMS